ncbi:hypothetical protein IYR97_26250 (plasmid) [Pseudomonas fulva]|jgi:hypothetical protein|uniref:Uncharacterized protein n=3 Tax=Pseudomonas TaxID=286 RepID=A0A1X0ZMU7_PSEPU|nr:MULTISPECIES: hypothetical protein [Pseudomonas]MCT8162888.1 hypothetical protein [Pseudomonas sp. HD6422]MCT8181343.1 hypothetical protein [Pseudomonas sp. HD6421]MDH1930556.1 hypothetical protein [Pseudomonas sp. GD03696]MDM1711659.1 hypothetical protein [Pseudomonas sp. 165]ORL52199.1 hypothetical protein B7H18_09295 [Pseudomonas putida]
MTESKQNHAEAFTTQASNKGWRPDQNLATDNPEAVPVWFYSHGYLSGSRLISQLLKDVFVNGVPPEALVDLPADPGNAYKAAIKQLERAPADQKEAEHQRLTAAMVNFAQSSNLWKILKSQDEITGFHIVLVDWFTRSNVHVLIPTAIMQPTPLSPDQIALAAKMAMDNHLCRYPKDVPASRRS